MNDYNNVILVGNANTGKTTLFNALAKQNKKTGNWHGVTNEVSFAEFKINKKNFKLYDIPGIYSLTPLSFEERVATDFIYQNTYGLFLNVCEQENIRRNLYLTLQLLELGVQTVLIVNTKGKPCDKNLNNISESLNLEVIFYKNKKDIEKIKNCILNYKNKKIQKLNYIQEILNNYDFNLVNKVVNKKINQNNKIKINKKNNKKLKENYCEFCDKNCIVCPQTNLQVLNLNDNFVKLKLLEGDDLFTQYYQNPTCQIEDVAIKRYNYINSILPAVNKTTVYGTSKLDKILLNKIFALPIFFALLFAIFYLTFFSLGAFISDCLQTLIDLIGNNLMQILSVYLKSGWFLDLIENSIVGGLGSVLKFLPQVCLLFLFLSILEDSGYLSRIAFLFEDILSKVGLSGKGVYTLLMGFGCSATSIMTARNMEDKNAKIKVALITPFFSCSAKLPIFAVLGGAFFGASNVFVIFGLYLLGVIIGVLLCFVMNKFLWKSKQQSFILEFAPLKTISFNRIAKITWDNIKQFLIRIGSLIICINVIVFIISSFTLDFKYIKECGGQSMLESFGKIIAPVFAPLGFGNWGSASALLAGLIAKEIVISSIAIFNKVSLNSTKLQDSLYNPSSVVFFTPFSALSFLVFCLLYTPCLTTLAVIKKELGTKFAIFAFFAQFAIAYFISFIVYSLITLNLTNLIIILTVGVLITLALVIYNKRKQNKNFLKQKTFLNT